MRSKRAATLTLMLAVVLVAGCGGGEGEAEEPSFREMVPGLQIMDLQVGTGDVVTSGDVVSVHYIGWLYDPEAATRGEIFDSSRDRGDPLTFPVGHGRVIEGWEQGLIGMHVGGKRQLLIAPELAYGEQGAPPAIPPSSTLLFEVDLIALPKASREVLVAGNGSAAELGDVVEVHYTGWIEAEGEKGEKFDSSLDRDMPFVFRLGAGQVIAGWEQGVIGMREGDKVMLTIPPELGYGARGVQRGSEVIIPGNATLLFEVELLKIRDE
jgi:peptidylprolyl isomerase